MESIALLSRPTAKCIAGAKAKTGSSATGINCKQKVASLTFEGLRYDSAVFYFASSCDRPRVIESLRGKDVVDVACGGAHSAAITTAGELFTWGKGRYGRLGHGDSEDQLKPKLVEALLGKRQQLLAFPFVAKFY